MEANGMKTIARTLLLTFVLASTLLLWHSPMAFATQDRDHIAAGSSTQHWTGTDELGRDRTLRLAGALLLGLAGSVFAAAIATGLAVGIGVFAAFAHSVVANCLLYLSDLFLTLPWLFLLMMVRSAMPLTMAPLQSAAVTFMLLGLLGWPAYARVCYATALDVRNAEWLVYGRAAGLRTHRLLRKHVLPHLRPLVLTQFLICVPAFLVAEANLGTLGLGVSEPLPSWGSMLLAMQSTAVLASSNWVYLPIVLLVVILFLIELLVQEVT